MKKVPVVTVYRYYFGIFRREIKIPYKIIDGTVIFERQLKENEKAIITFRYKE